MTFFLSCLAGAVILGFSSWGSNIWPGRHALWRAAVSRLLWWGGPFGLIAILNDVSPYHALWLASAAWLGAWIPHTEMPDVASQQSKMMVDLGVVVLRVTGLLLLPTATFWVCGAYWFAMICAVASVIPCVLIGNIMVTLPMFGLRTKQQIAGVLFGLATGMWISVAINAPTPWADRLL